MAEGGWPRSGNSGWLVKSQNEPFGFKPWGPFLEGPEKFSHPESHSKISNLMITELFYSHILNMNRGSLHTSSVRRIHLSVFRYR